MGEGEVYMDKQLTFNLPEIDREATKKAVEGMLEKARLYKQIGFIRREIKSTPSYEPRFHGNTYTVSKQTESISVWNVDAEQKMIDIVKKVDRAVDRLNRKERDIIIKRYLDNDESYDYILCNELGMSERSYRRVKARAIYKLAFMLRLEVMIETEKVSGY